MDYLKSGDVPPEYRLITLRSAFATDPDGNEIAVQVVDSVSFIRALGKPTISQTLLPDEFALKSVYPNPFNSYTTVLYDLPEESHVTLDIYNVLGNKIRTLVTGKMEAGFHSVTWDGKNDRGESISSGMYMIQMHAADYQKIMKCILLR